MVLLHLICINFLGLSSSLLCMFFMFVNDEEPISYFNLVFLFFLFFVFCFFFFVFLVLGGERHKMGVKKLIYPSF